MVANGNGNQLWYQMNHNKILGKSPKVWRKTDTNSRSGEQIYGGVTPFGLFRVTKLSILHKITCQNSSMKFLSKNTIILTKTVNFRPKMAKIYSIIQVGLNRNVKSGLNTGFYARHFILDFSWFFKPKMDNFLPQNGKKWWKLLKYQKIR